MAESYSLKAILSADGSQMSSTFDKIAGQVGGLQKTLMGGIGFGVMSAIGGKAVDLVSSGIKAMGSTVIDSGMSFEAAGSQIAATMGKSKSEISNIIAEAERLGATTSFTATQAAEGFNVLAMSGLDAQQQIAAMAPILDLAAAGSYSLDSAASQVVGTVKGFGDSFDNAQYYADMFAKGATLASTDVNMLGVAMSDSAALASSYGQEADRTCIALLRLAEQNVTGSEAATAMSRAMADLYTPTDAAAGMLEELGVNVYDSSGKARDFNTVVDELNAAMSDMTDEERKAAEATIFTSYGMKAFDKMCVSSTEKVHEFEEGLRSATGSAAAQASEQLNNLKGDVTIFGSAMEGLGVTVFNKLSPSFRGIVQAATEMVTGINNVLSGNAFTGSGFIANALKYFAKFIQYAKQVGKSFGTAFSAVGKALAKINSKFGSLSSLNSFARKCSAAKAAFSSLASFIESHADQIAQVIAAIPKAAAAFAGLSVAGKLTPLLQGAMGAAGGLADVFSSKVPTAALSAGKSFSSLAGKAGKGLVNAAKEAKIGLLNIAPPSVLGKISGAMDVVEGKFSGFGETIKNKLVPPDSIGAAIAGKLKSIGGPVASAITSVGGKATSTVTTVISKLMSLALQLIAPAAIIAVLLAGMGLIYSTFGSQIDQILALAQEKGPGIISGLVNGITTALPGLIMAGAQMMAGLMNTVTANLPALISGGVAIIGSLVNGLGGALPTLIPAAVNMVGTLVSGLLGALPQVISIGMQFLLSLAQGIAANIPLILAKAHEAATNFIQGVITNLPTILTTAAQIVTTLVQGIVAGLPQLLSQGVQLIGMIIQGIASSLPTIIGSGAQIIGSLLAGIVGAVGTLIGSIPGIMGQLVDTIMATDWLKVGSDILQAIGEGLFGGITSIGGKIGSFFSNAKDWVTGGKEGGTKTVTSAQESVAAGSGAFAASVGTMAQGGAQAYSTGITQISTATDTTMAAVASSLTTAETGITSLQTTATGGMAEVLASFSNVGATANTEMSSVTSAMTAAGEGVNTMQSSMNSGMSSMQSTVTSTMSAVGNAAKSGTTNAVQAISNGGQKASQAVTTACQSITRTMQSAATQAGSAGTQMGQRFMTGVRTGCAAAAKEVQTACQTIIRTMQSAATQAGAVGTQMGLQFAEGIRTGGASAVSTAQDISNNAANAMRSGYDTAYSAGSYIGQGLASGLASQAGAVASQAAALANAANAAIAAKAKIGSPSKVTTQYGKWYGEGWINGISAKVKDAARTARELVAIPEHIRDVHAADFLGTTELDERYEYTRTETIITKTYLDGREIARSEAPYRRAMDAQDARKTGRPVRRPAYG